MYHLNKFCNIIFELRKEHGWTQTMLAEKLGIAHNLFLSGNVA